MKRLRIGTRSSALALWQANHVAKLLRNLGTDTEIVHISTIGDQNQSEPIEKIGAQGVFTKEIQKALLRGEIDVAVHSLKDLPTNAEPGLFLAAVPKRESPFDVFLSRRFQTIESLPNNAVIGTGSVRRRTQLINIFGSRFEIKDIRGNVETRLRKLTDGEYDGIILAEAGLSRLGFANEISEYLKPPLFLPAIGQGALGLEIRENDNKTASKVEPLSVKEAYYSVLAERAFLRTLQGGCSSPIAAICTENSGIYTLQGRILSPDGLNKIDGSLTDSIRCTQDAQRLGCNLAIEML